MATRLSKAFGRTPESWLQLQMQYDLAQVSARMANVAVQPLTGHVPEPV